ALPEDERQAVLLEDQELLTDWDEVHGDRINKVVFIGIEMDGPQIISTLDDCLLSDEELEQDWSSFQDDLPNPVQEEEAVLH
ncbi:GTP-binding protein, partial [Paenibacillus sepulcri]|nr:GTP-binding protein [Paenibacillus sepulcri]